MTQPVEPTTRRIKPSAITAGAVAGVAGIPVAYVLLRAFGLIISDALLLACVAAPTVILLALTVVPRLRRWAPQAALASAITSVLLAVVVGGGIALVAYMLSDPA